MRKRAPVSWARRNGRSDARGLWSGGCKVVRHAAGRSPGRVGKNRPRDGRGARSQATPEAHGLRRRNAGRRKLKSQTNWIAFRNFKASRASKGFGGVELGLI